MAADLWTVVLAAGSGRRLAPVTHGTPKQFWCSGAGRSLLDETFARVAPLAPGSRTAVVVDRTHRRYVTASAGAWPAEWLLYQPADRGTAVGVLLALSPILDSAKDAIVLLTPSDHGVGDSVGFHAGVRDAAAAVESGEVDIVLFGVEPTEAVSDYGWITPGDKYRWAEERPLRPVRAFTEKPSLATAQSLFAARALWNTMVMVANVLALRELYEIHLPHWAEAFTIYRRLPQGEREAFLTDQYSNLPSADFSRDLLTPARGLAVYSWPRSMGWSDLGTPERLYRWLSADERKGLECRHLMGAGQ